MASKSKPITAAGRRRVEQAFERHGLLLVQGQDHLPSLADLLANEPVTTKGYSWDYVPAWNLRWELEQRPDVVNLKLFAGKSTLVHQRLWPAVDALAVVASEGVLDGHGPDDRRAMLELVQDQDGITGEAIKQALGWHSRRFQRVKNDLCRWLCVWGEVQDDDPDESHTHDMVWLPWHCGKLARGLPDEVLPSPSEALRELGRAVFPGDMWPSPPPPWRKLFPVVDPVAYVLKT